MSETDTICFVVFTNRNSSPANHILQYIFYLTICEVYMQYYQYVTKHRYIHTFYKSHFFKRISGL